VIAFSLQVIHETISPALDHIPPRCSFSPLHLKQLSPSSRRRNRLIIGWPLLSQANPLIAQHHFSQPEKVCPISSLSSLHFSSFSLSPPSPPPHHPPIPHCCCCVLSQPCSLFFPPRHLVTNVFFLNFCLLMSLSATDHPDLRRLRGFVYRTPCFVIIYAQQIFFPPTLVLYVRFVDVLSRSQQGFFFLPSPKIFILFFPFLTFFTDVHPPSAMCVSFPAFPKVAEASCISKTSFAAQRFFPNWSGDFWG